MRKNLTPLLLGCLSAVLASALVGCTRDVIIDLPDAPPRLYMVSHFAPDEPFRVTLGVTTSIKDTLDPVHLLTNVQVTLSTDTGATKRFILKDGPQSYWQSADSAVIGQQYKLTISADGYPPISASSSAPAPVRLQPLNVNPASWSEVDIENGRRKTRRVPLQLELSELPANARYFAFKISHQLNDVDGNPSSAETASQFLADGRTFALLHDIPESVVLVNENFWTDGPNGHTLFLDALIPYDPQEEMPSKLLIEWRTLSEEFYRYHLSLSRQGNLALPFNDPDAVYNNVSGGFGNFSGYSVVYYEVSL